MKIFQAPMETKHSSPRLKAAEGKALKSPELRFKGEGFSGGWTDLNKDQSYIGKKINSAQVKQAILGGKKVMCKIKTCLCIIYNLGTTTMDSPGQQDIPSDPLAELFSWG